MRKAQKSTSAGRRSKALLALVLAGLFGAGCAPTQHSGLMAPSQAAITPPHAAVNTQAQTEINNTLASLALQTSTSSADYRLGPEDLVEITIFNVMGGPEEAQTPRKTQVRVSQQGKLTLPLLGEVTVAGLTPSALEQLLQEQYKKYIRDPHVGVFVVEYQSHQISVTGEVNHPGVIKITGPKTLIDLLTMAGGVNEQAGRQVHLYRQGPEGRENYVVDLYDLMQHAETVNLPVQTGDVINVPKAGMFFVDGAVKNPGAFPMNRPYTFTQAVNTAGGITWDLAKTSNITIIRHPGSGKAEMLPPIDLAKIQSGEAEDPVIQAEDMIYVPISTTKYLVLHFISGFSLGQLFYLH
jgi:polysaccharide biosynthesis/export protein